MSEAIQLKVNPHQGQSITRPRCIEEKNDVKVKRHGKQEVSSLFCYGEEEIHLKNSQVESARTVRRATRITKAKKKLTENRPLHISRDKSHCTPIKKIETEKNKRRLEKQLSSFARKALAPTPPAQETRSSYLGGMRKSLRRPRPSDWQRGLSTNDCRACRGRKKRRSTKKKKRGRPHAKRPKKGVKSKTSYNPSESGTNSRA